MIYFDNAATSWPKPDAVRAAHNEYFADAGGNPGRSGHRRSIAAARLAGEFQFRFVALSQNDEAEPRLAGAGVRKLVASSLARAAGVVTDSPALGALLSKNGFRKERMTLVSKQESAAEACHRLLLPVRG